MSAIFYLFVNLFCFGDRNNITQKSRRSIDGSAVDAGGGAVSRILPIDVEALTFWRYSVVKYGDRYDCVVSVSDITSFCIQIYIGLDITIIFDHKKV